MSQAPGQRHPKPRGPGTASENHPADGEAEVRAVRALLAGGFVQIRTVGERWGEQLGWKTDTLNIGWDRCEMS